MALFTHPRVTSEGRLAALAPGERRNLVAMVVSIGALHLLGWGTLIAVVVPQHLESGGAAFGLGIGATAYVLGLRHAFDVDHIAAIDNTTRRLMGRGERPLSVGFWFSLGHSTIVLALTLLIVLGSRSLPHTLTDGHSSVHGLLALIGTALSACFLFAIAFVNAGSFAGSWRLFVRLRGGNADEAAIDEQLNNGGLVSRIVQRAGKPVDRPWHMYVVGLLFGLGFDTATEIALLVAAGTGSASGLPWYAILCLPVLFAAGMSLLDTIDGTFMNFAYDWSLSQPLRKIYYNLTITGLSIAVAVIVGVVEILTLLNEELQLGHDRWGFASGVNLNGLGLLIVGLFCFTWAACVVICRCAQIEQR
jgi:high-affinity nickel-transport protein